MLPKIRDWIFTVPFLVFFAATLIVFDVAGRLALLISMRSFERVMGRLQRTLMEVFKICGTRIEVEVSPKIQRNTGYVIISNHQSMFDIAMIGGVMLSNYPKYVAKKELGRWIPSISLNLSKGGNALIDRRDRHQAVDAIEDMARVAQDRGVSVVIFPEGTRSRDGSLGRFSQGGSKALLKAADRLEVVPVAIDGSWKLLRHNLAPVPFGTRVRMRLGDPIGRADGDGSDLVAASEAWISATLDEWRLATAET